MALSNLLMRDCVIMKKGDTVTCIADESLLGAGWKDGVALTFAEAIAVDGKMIPVVTLPDGIHQGPIAMWGSDEPEDTQISYTGQYKRYRYVQCTYGNQIFLTRNFETVSFFQRTGLSNLTDKYGNSHAVINASNFTLEYKAGLPLYISERGYFTTEKICNESIQWFTVFSSPSSVNSNFLGAANIA